MSRFRTINRRTMLRGAGAAMGLPFLEAMLPRTTFAGTPAVAKPPIRTAFFYVPNGQNMAGWKMPKGGAGLPDTLQPLKKVADRVIIFSGLNHNNARALGDGPGDHARDSATFLTGAHPKKTNGKDIKAGVSADQFLAQKIGGATRFPSLELGTKGGAQSGNCDSGYSCAYSSNISWRTPSSPMAKEINPKNLYLRLFGDPKARASALERKRESEFMKSALDLVLDDAKDLRRRLGKGDQEKVDEYLESVRHIEKGIQASGDAPAGPPEDLKVPDGVPRDHGAHIRLIGDLLIAAFQTNATRVATFMLANSGSNRTFPSIGVKGGHHSISHHGRDAGKMGDIKKIDTFYMQQFAAIVEKMSTVKEERGTLLDNVMLLYGGAIGDGDRHNHDNLPILLAGRGGGSIKSGRHVNGGGKPVCNLFLSLFARMGVNARAFGDSNGVLAF